MKLEELKQRGGLVPVAPVVKRVRWTTTDGEEVEFDVGVRRLSMGDWEAIMFHDDDQRSASARILSAVIILGEGDDAERMTYRDAYQLQPTLANALMAAHNEVNPRPAKKA
jgi:hypothetical protein